MLGWSEPRRNGRPGNVTSMASAASRAVSSLPRRSVAALREGGLDGDPDGVGDGADLGPVVGAERADPAQDAGEAALLAEDVELERFERRRVRGGLDRAERVVAAASRGRGSGRRGPRCSLRHGSGITNPRPSSTSRARVVERRSGGSFRRPSRRSAMRRRSRCRGRRGRPGSCGRSRCRPS